MKTIFIDSEFRCHTSGDGAMTAVETEAFDGKCDTYIEGYRFIPEGETWVRSDGIVFRGEMIAPWRDYAELDNAQRNYERQLLAEYEAAMANSIPVTDLEAAYQKGVNSAYD